MKRVEHNLVSGSLYVAIGGMMKEKAREHKSFKRGRIIVRLFQVW